MVKMRDVFYRCMGSLLMVFFCNEFFKGYCRELIFRRVYGNFYFK